MDDDGNNGTVPEYDYQNRPETYIVPVLFTFIFFVGTIGNGSLVLIFFRHKHMINVPNIYILSLALGDLLVLLGCIPFTSIVYTLESWPFGATICKVSETARDISIGVTVFTLTALSADRFFAIVDPMRKLHASVGGRRATKFTVTVAVTIWCLAIACAAPAAAYSYIRKFQNGYNVTMLEVCYPYPEELGPNFPQLAVLVKFIIYYVVPLSAIACFYIMMARHLINSTKNMPGEVQGQIRQLRARKKVAKTVLAFVLVFAVCFLPNHIFLLWFYINPKAVDEYNVYWHVLRIAGFCLLYSNSCINPIALYLVSGTFRKHFDRQLFWWFVKAPGVATVSRNGYIRRKNGTREKDRGTINESTTMANMQMSTFTKRTADMTTITTVLATGPQDVNNVV